MKKISIYLLSLLTIAGTTACNEDFNDWAGAQTNPQEDAKNLTLEMANTQTTFDLGTITTDSLDLAAISSVSVEEGDKVSYEVLFGKEESLMALPFTEESNQIKVATLDLEDAVWAAYGKKGSSRDLNLQVNAVISTAMGQASRVEGNTLNVTVVTKTLPIEEAYYLVGDLNGWSQNEPWKFESKGNGIFELVVNPEQDGSNFKIIPESGVTEGADFWGSALGTAVNGDKSSTGTIVSKRRGVEPGAIQIAKAGEQKIILDMNDYSYSVVTVTHDMYINGSPWGWNWDNADDSMIAINGMDGGFWRIIYLNAGDQIKFSPVKAWNGDFGYNDSNFSPESIELAGLSEEGGNIKIGKSGWYIIKITTDASGIHTVEFRAPNVYLMGDTSFEGWANQLGDKDKFSVPETADGEFVSPAFLQSGAVRMCVNLNVDWWKSEFNVFDGTIVFRGNGGDQSPVQGAVGEKVYLKFSDNTGRIQ